MENKVALFDMDNTLFDYEGQIRRNLRSLMAPGETESIDLHDESKPYLKNRMELIKSTPGWWRNLPKHQPGFDVYDMAESIGFDCHVLTKGPDPKITPLAWTEKAQCVVDHFGNKMSLDIVGKNKSARYGRVLVEDYPEYILGWLQHRPRGLVILIDQHYNRNFNHKQVVRYSLPSDMFKVRQALQAAYVRPSGQSWQEHI